MCLDLAVVGGAVGSGRALRRRHLRSACGGRVGLAVVSGRHRDSRRSDRCRRRAGQRAGERAHRRPRHGGGAGLHRYSLAWAARNRGGADGGELSARRRDDDRGRPRRQFAAADRAVSGRDPEDGDLGQLRDHGGAGKHPAVGDRAGQPHGHGGGDREDEGAGGAGHARRRVRPFHRPVLRAGQFHADRGSDRTRQGGGKDGRHTHFPHARGGLSRIGQRAGDDSHRRGGRAADADHAPQDDRAAELGQERGVAQAGGRGAGARRGRDHRSVSVHGIEHGNRRAGAAMGAGGRAEIDRRTAGRTGPARADQGGDRAEPEGGPRRRRSQERGDRQLRVRPLAGRQESDATHAGARGGTDDGERRRDGDGTGGQGRLFGGLSRDRRGGRGAHHALAVHDDRVGRRYPGVRPGGAASAQLRDVRARARSLRAGEERADAGRCGAAYVGVPGAAAEDLGPRDAAARA